MNKSETISTLAKALAEAQKNIGAAVKESENPFFKSKYADLGSVMAVCKVPLLAQGVSVLQLVGKDDKGGYLETILLHSSGEFISDRMELVCAKQHDPQAMGSAITYARRYALQSALFIPAEDDDGENAMRPTREIQQVNEQAERRQEQRERSQASGHHEPEHGFQDVKRTMKGDWGDVVVPFGKDKGRAIGELPPSKLKWYQEQWQPKPYNGSISPKDTAFRAALDSSMATTSPPPPAPASNEDDEIPF